MLSKNVQGRRKTIVKTSQTSFAPEEPAKRPRRHDFVTESGTSFTGSRAGNDDHDDQDDGFRIHRTMGIKRAPEPSARRSYLNRTRWTYEPSGRAQSGCRSRTDPQNQWREIAGLAGSAPLPGFCEHPQAPTNRVSSLCSGCRLSWCTPRRSRRPSSSARTRPPKPRWWKPAPRQWSIYTRDELRTLCEQNRVAPLSPAELRKVHEIKRTFSGRITS